MKQGLTDIHEHLLWGIDDGAPNPESMHRMLLSAGEQGITRIFATAHAVPGYHPFDRELYNERLNEARLFCRENGLDIDIQPGAEIAWTYQTVDAVMSGKVPTLGGTEYVLLELWRDVSVAEARKAVESLRGVGYVPILAHVERYRVFKWFPGLVARFRETTGALMQVNANTLMHPANWRYKRFVQIMLKNKAIDAVATDSHGIKERPMNLKKAYEWLRQHTDEEYARSLSDGHFL